MTATELTVYYSIVIVSAFCAVMFRKYRVVRLSAALTILLCATWLTCVKVPREMDVRVHTFISHIEQPGDYVSGWRESGEQVTSLYRQVTPAILISYVLIALTALVNVPHRENQ